jgi:dolichyl-phosphate beta-glucosyltransferase
LNPHLSVVIPCFNEARKIETDIQAALSYFGSVEHALACSSFELILVDDGSADGTAEILNQATNKLKHVPHSVRAICYKPNRGKGHAVRTGMLAARGRYRLFADAGLCVPYSEIEKGLALLEAGADVAIGSRKLSESHVVEQQAGYRRIGSSVFGLLVRNWMGLRYSDTQCGFKLFTAQAAERLFSAARIDGFMFDAETLINARKFNLTVKEFPVEWHADPDSRYKPFSGSLRNLVELVRIQLQ